MRRVRNDLAATLLLLGREDAELSIVFVGSLKMKKLNTEHRGVPQETDVLSFPQKDDPATAFPAAPIPHPQSLILGDIVISVPKAAAQAKTYGVSFHDEMRRLLIHGLLHLLGYDHERSRYQRLKMEKKESELLHAVQGMD